MDEPIKPVRVRGKAKRQSESELEQDTSPDALREMMNEAGEDWKELAPRAFKTILESEPTNE